MANSFDISIQGNVELKIKLSKIAKSVKDLTPAFVAMRPLIIKEFKQNFDTAGSTLGKKWAPRKRSYPWPILRKSGKLKATWSDNIQSLSMVISNPVKYAKYHHFGTFRLPVRAIVGVNPTITQDVVKSIQIHINRAIN